METTRTVILRPFVAGKPYYLLEILTNWQADRYGKIVCYFRLTRRQKGKPPIVIFDGEEEPEKWYFAGHFQPDSDEAVEAAGYFATLQPVDVDPEFFEDYSPSQLAFLDTWEVEALHCYVQDRFGEDR